MFILGIYITIGKLTLTGVTDVAVTQNWRNLTQTATIQIPRKAYLNNVEVKVKDYVKVGDAVTIKAGYNNDLKTEFEGFVRTINPNRPMVFECEDRMYQFKRDNLSRVFKPGTTLKQYVSSFYSGAVKYIDPNIKLGQIELINATPAMALDELRKTYHLYSIFRGSTLVIGWPYDPSTQQTHIFNPDINMVDNSSLTYRTKEETKLRLTGISLFSDGSRITYHKGDEGGDQQTRHYYAITEADLKKNVDREYDLAVYEGWRGYFTAWGQPFVQVGDVVDLRNNYYPEYNGKYLVDATTLRINRNGMRRQITLGPSAGSVINQ
jgi:hypothetical protein